MDCGRWQECIIAGRCAASFGRERWCRRQNALVAGYPARSRCDSTGAQSGPRSCHRTTCKPDARRGKADPSPPFAKNATGFGMTASGWLPAFMLSRALGYKGPRAARANQLVMTAIETKPYEGFFDCVAVRPEKRRPRKVLAATPPPQRAQSRRVLGTPASLRMTTKPTNHGTPVPEKGPWSASPATRNIGARRRAKQILRLWASLGRHRSPQTGPHRHSQKTRLDSHPNVRKGGAHVGTP